MPQPERKRLYLVDGMSQIYRAYYAIRGLSNSHGLATNAIYGFTMMLRRLIANEKPDYLGVAFDSPERTFRHEAFEQYKATRGLMPDDLEAQLPYIARVCEALRVPITREPGFEADDIIGTFSCQAEAAGLDVVIVTNDKDMCQLVTDHVKILRTERTGDLRLLDSAGVEEKLGVKPNQVVDLLGLWGDASDNIPGAPGVGEKGAKQIIRQFGSIDNAMAHADEIQRKTYRESLKNNSEIIIQSRELARIKCDMPIKLDLEALRYEEPDRRAAYELFSELEFGQLTREFADAATYESVATVAARKPGKPRYSRITTAAELERFAKSLWSLDRFAFSVAVREGRLYGVAISTAQMNAALVDFDKFEQSADPLSVVKEVLENGLVRKSVHDWKGALTALDDYTCERAPADKSKAKKAVEGCIQDFTPAIRIEGVEDDAMLAAYLLDPNRTSYRIHEIAREYMGLEVAKSVEGFDAEDARALQTADLTFHLADVLRAKLEAMGLEHVYSQIELPLVEILFEMERIGVRIDVASLEKAGGEMEQELERLTAEIYRLAGQEFNINSTVQLGEVFEKLNFEVTRKTKTGRISTSVDVLEELAAKYELPRLIIEYREIAKLKSTYVDALPKQINPRTGRLHTTLNQAVAATGRLSSTNPNLQNIPIRSELGRRIRRAFVASPGYVLMSADYSQIELRLFAHITGDPVMTEAFTHGEDIHARTARAVFGAKTKEELAEARRVSKIVNFAIAYDIGAFGLAQRTGLSRAEAKRVIDDYYKTYTGVRRYMQETPEQVRETGVVRTIFGRIRPIPDINNRNHNLRARAEREAINAPIQGCLPYKTMVLTSEGYRSIGELYENGCDGLKVWTGTRFAPFKALNRGRCELAEIHLANGKTLQCDTRHEVLVVTEACYAWKKYTELEVGDKICLSLPREIEYGSILKPRYSYKPKAPNGLPVVIEDLDESFFYWLGFYFGDGWIAHQPNAGRWNLSYSIGAAEAEEIEKITVKAYECAEYFGRLGLRAKSRWQSSQKLEVKIHSKGLIEFLEKVGVNTRANAHTKRVPKFVFNSPLAHRKAFLSGVFDSDGCQGSNGRSNPSIHLCQRELLEDLWLLFRTVGVESKLRGPYHYNGYISYRLDLIGGMLKKSMGFSEAKSVNIPDVRAPQFLVSAFLNRVSPSQLSEHSHRVLHSRLKHGGKTSVYALAEMIKQANVDFPMPVYAWSRLKEKRPLGFEEQTYTLAVDDPLHCFDSEGIISKNTAADVVKMAMIRVYERLKREKLGARMMLQVHDELLLEVPEKEIERATEVVREEMEKVYPLSVPLVVDVGTGRNWMEAKP